MSNQPDKLNERAARPSTLAGALGGLLQILGVRASDADLTKNWNKIVGAEISQIAKIVGVRKLRDGRFSVALRPVNPAFALQLSYRTPDITDRINKYYGRDAVAKITIRK